MQGGAYGPNTTSALMSQKTDYTLLLVAVCLI